MQNNFNDTKKYVYELKHKIVYSLIHVKKNIRIIHIFVHIIHIINLLQHTNIYIVQRENVYAIKRRKSK